MLGGVVEELVVGVRIGEEAASGVAQVPASEDPRRRVHVLLRVVADPPGEQLHDLAREVLLRPGTDVQPAVEPYEHRRIARDLDQEIAKVAEGKAAEQLDLPGPPR